MTVVETSFFVSGGALPHNAPSYVSRWADTELLESLRRGEFCYVLTSRQMGKTSLMGSTANRLRQEGITAVSLDLTAVGQNVTIEQWYFGLLGRLGRSMRLKEELENYWLNNTRLGVLQRFMSALHDVVLGHISGPIVIFVDEIDYVRSLPFSTDEFFAAIRDVYNRRNEEPVYNRLSFCLLGSASPSDLIQDVRVTPFNIGRRIELTDFTEAEAAPLAQGLGRDEKTGKALLSRVLYWTRGHPYLTQRLCQTVAEQTQIRSATDVDRACAELFLSPRARERDSNLLFVRDRLLRKQEDRAGLLDLYQQVLIGRRVKDDETNPLVTALRLSGIVRVEGGYLRVRNRIYKHVFNREWVRINLPDAELRRQRAVYRRGLVRVISVVSIMSLLLAAVVQRTFNAQKAEANARHQADIAHQQSRLAKRREAEANEARSKLDAVIHVKLNLRGAYLAGASLQNAELSMADLSGVNFERANLNNSNLRLTNLQGADLQDANLRNADLHGANLRGTDLRGADLTDARNVTAVQIREAIISHKTKLPEYLAQVFSNRKKRER